MLWRNSLIMQDRETGSWWSHVLGTALHGPAKGRQLEIVPSVQTTWARWSAEHPDASLLNKSEEVLSSRYAKYFEDPDRAGLFRARWLVERMPPKVLVWGVARGPHAVAVTDGALEEGNPVAVELGDSSAVVVRGSDGGAQLGSWTGLRSAGAEVVGGPAWPSEPRVAGGP